MKRLKDKHQGETVWIIGKGYSLIHIKRSDIGSGPIIAIYESLVPIEVLGFPNEIYSLQKDGGLFKDSVAIFDNKPISPDCTVRQCDKCPGVVRPARAGLILHDLESKYCFEDYEPRYVFTLEEIGLPENQFSLVCAIKIGQLMGCTKFKFVSFDAHTSGDPRNAILFHVDGKPIKTEEYFRWIYGMQVKLLPPFLEGLDYEWITPEK